MLEVEVLVLVIWGRHCCVTNKTKYFFLSITGDALIPNKWIEYFSSGDNRHALPLFTSLLNVLCSYDPVGIGNFILKSFKFVYIFFESFMLTDYIDLNVHIQVFRTIILFSLIVESSWWRHHFKFFALY